MRRAQSTVEYMITIAVLSIAVLGAMYFMLEFFQDPTMHLGSSLTTTLVSDSIQPTRP